MAGSRMAVGLVAVAHRASAANVVSLLMSGAGVRTGKIDDRNGGDECRHVGAELGARRVKGWAK